MPSPRPPVTRLPLLMGLLALAGLFCLVLPGVWALTRATAVGFVLAVFGTMAALVAQWDQHRRGRPDYVRVVLLPAAISASLVVGAIVFQHRELGFLHPEARKVLVTMIDVIPSLPEAPSPSPTERPMAAMEKSRQGRDGWRTVGPVEKPAPLRREELPQESPTDVDAGSSPLPATAGSSFFTPREAPRPLPKPVASIEASLDEAGMREALQAGHLDRCIKIASGNLDVSGRIEVEIDVTPAGRAREVRILRPDHLKGSSLETCFDERASRTQFPPFAGERPRAWRYTF